MSRIVDPGELPEWERELIDRQFRERKARDWHRRRSYYTVGWVIAVLTLYAAHELDGHWLGAIIVVAGYVTGAIYVARQELPHG